MEMEFNPSPLLYHPKGVIFLFNIPKEIADEMYTNKQQEIIETHIVELNINYQISAGVWDKFKQTWTIPLQNKTISIVCAYREDNKIGQTVSSQIINGIPLGDFKVFIPYVQRFDKATITNYIDGSLSFVLRPNSSNPITLYPKVNGVSIEYLFDKQEYPLVQRWLCSVQKLA